MGLSKCFSVIMMSGWAPMWAAKLARDVKMWSKLVGLKNLHGAKVGCTVGCAVGCGVGSKVGSVVSGWVQL